MADSLLKSLLTTRIGDVTLLGALLFPGPSLDKAWSDRYAELSRASSRLSQIGAQEALMLLRGFFSALKVLHLLRCSPSVSHPALSDFDRLLRLAVERITNSSLTDTQWLQASLPIKDGGLGVRRVSSLALPAFLASAAGTALLQAEILAYWDVPEDPYLKEYLELWSASGSAIPEPLPLKQSSWDRPGIEKDRTSIESGLTTTLQRASFNTATSRHSGDWLQALPSTSCGLKLDDEAIRVEVGIRLALDLCVPHQCRCGSQVDSFGRHSLVCKQAPGRTVRHPPSQDLLPQPAS